mgnify:CR=1 FL=1
MNCDGLMQIVVNPRSSCAGIDASASPRSATPSGPSNRPSRAAHHLELGGVSAGGRHPRTQPLEILVGRAAERVEPAAELDQPPQEPLVHRLAAEPQRRASGRNGLGSSQTSEKR